ncbi:peptidase M61 [Lampropedia cohaerens]|uniref:Peptidase M61 n=1 Tax=Lampropedia cohaerens TaxID=1610491 RepID=A0A0U1Q0Q5_9BURK|nr:M61 family metallopeptidase [Lampropedia cohaerens]KKW68337.1 peptidase M61 [Lampropedia cohaerens]
MTTFALHYQVAAEDPHSHHFHITLHIAKPARKQRVSLPVWIPGSYLVREFARHLSSLQASQNGAHVHVTPLSKNSWEIACDDEEPLTLQWRVYAFDNSVRAAWLDAQRGFFNPTSLCLRVHGQERLPHTLTLLRPACGAQWQVATALRPLHTDADGFGSYQAADYDELADSPVEMGLFWSASFDVLGIAHRFVVAGAPPRFDGQRLLADAKRICEAAIRFWHPEVKDSAVGIAPHDRYVFLLNAVGNGYGGLEHRHSTALICNRSDLPRSSVEESAQPEGYRTLLGLISHEYFHTWNVKRMRPAEFASYDWDQENYTQLLWFFEGFTSYYDDLLLRRAGLLSDEQYLKLLAKTIHQVAQTPGQAVQSVAQASFDAWIKYYRQDENTINATVSYYTKGALVALCLDLQLRQEGKTDLDAVMRALWQRSAGGPIGETDILDTLKALSGRSWKKELKAWVHGTDPLPLPQTLATVGITLEFRPPSWMLRLGLLVQESNGSVIVRRVLSGSAAAQAGMAAGDEWLGIRLPAVAGKAPQHMWRIRKLEELDMLLQTQLPCRFDALVARDGVLLWLPTSLTQENAGQGEAHLVARDAKVLLPWLTGAP